MHRSNKPPGPKTWRMVKPFVLVRSEEGVNCAASASPTLSVVGSSLRGTNARAEGGVSSTFGVESNADFPNRLGRLSALFLRAPNKGREDAPLRIATIAYRDFICLETSWQGSVS